MWSAAVKTANYFVFQAFCFGRILGTEHLFPKSGDFFT
jgi:hypothetical protein